MKNKKTTIAGYLALLAGIFSAGAKIVSGDSPSSEDLATIIAGVGLVMAQDGGH